MYACAKTIFLVQMSILFLCVYTKYICAHGARAMDAGIYYRNPTSSAALTSLCCGKGPPLLILKYIVYIVAS